MSSHERLATSQRGDNAPPPWTSPPSSPPARLEEGEGDLSRCQRYAIGECVCALDPLDKDVELDGIIELFEIHWIYLLAGISLRSKRAVQSYAWLE